MRAVKKPREPVLAGRFEHLVEVMPPQAICNGHSTICRSI